MNKEFERQENFILKLKCDFHTIAWGDQADILSYIPKGWEKIIYDLFNCIDNYYKEDSRRFEDTLICKYKFTHNRVLNVIKYGITKYLNPYKGLFDNENKTRIITNNIEAHARQTTTWKVREIIYNIFEFLKFDTSKHWVSKHPEIFEVYQIKEKFSELRIYYGGGDDKVQGMIMMAEHLASKTCELTGNPGEVCNAGGWWCILSKEKQEELGVLKN